MRLALLVLFRGFVRVVGFAFVVALLVTLFTCAARAGHVDLIAGPPWQNVDGSPANLTGAHYEWSVGCGVPGRYELGTRVSPTAAIRIDALPDSGRCYFRVTPVLATGVAGLISDEAIFDFDLVRQIPATPLTGPLVTWSAAPTAPARATLTLTWWPFSPNSEFDLRIQNTGTVTLQSVQLVLADQVFDWLRGGSFTPANLTTNNDDIESRSATITTPVAPGATLNMQGDVDTRNPSGLAATFTFSGLPAITKTLAVTSTGFAGAVP